MWSALWGDYSFHSQLFDEHKKNQCTNTLAYFGPVTKHKSFSDIETRIFNFKAYLKLTRKSILRGHFTVVS